MRIISPSGRMFKISSIDPFVEVQYELNGMKHRVVDVARNMSMKPTAIKFYVKSKDNYSDPHIYVGNLKPEKVQEIMEHILKEKNYDFSKLQYQEEDYMGDYILDAGESLPYYDEQIYEHMCFPNFSTKFPMMEG